MLITTQQIDAISKSRQGVDFNIRARAGTGKTSTIELIGKDNLQKNILLLYFNASPAAEARERMPANIAAKTFHALAYPTYGKYFQNRVKLRFIPKKIAAVLGCDEKIAIAAKYTVRRFTASSDNFIAKFHIPKLILKNYKDNELSQVSELIVNVAQKLWIMKTDFKNREIPVEFDDWLKMFQLDGARLKSRYDAIIVDEAQDTTPRDLDIIKKISGQKILVGDEFQQLYAWRGAINSLSESGIKTDLYLTKSFRFGDLIAERANDTLRLLQHNTPELSGDKTKDSQIFFDKSPPIPHTVLCRTNGGLFIEALNAIRSNRKIHVVGSLSDSVNLLESGWYLSIGEKTKAIHPTISVFDTWNALTENVDEDTDLKMLVANVTKYNSSIPYLCSEIRRAGEYPENQAEVILSTVHKAKGRQWPTVKLAEDFPDCFIAYSKKDNCYKVKKAEVYCYYVAITRAQYALYANSTMLQIKNWLELLPEK